MKGLWLVLAVLLTVLPPQFVHAEAPAMRRSTLASNLYGARALEALRQRSSGLLGNAKGVLVIGVLTGSQADAAGLRLGDVAKGQVGDVIVSYAGQPIDTAESLISAVSKHSFTNGIVELGLIRNNAKMIVKLACGKIGLELLTVASIDAGPTLVDANPEAEADNKSQIFPQLGHASECLAISPDGRFALTGSDKAVKLWEISSGREMRTFNGHTEAVLSVAFSPNGRYALSGSMDGVLKLWEIATGKPVQTIKGHVPTTKLAVAISPDGREALSGAGEGEIKLWDLASGLKIRSMAEVPASMGKVISVALSPDGRHALSAQTFFASTGIWGNKMHYVLKLWDVATGQLLRAMEEHSMPVYSVAFSPDGRLALSGSLDRTVKLWDLATGRVVRSMVHSSPVKSVAFSPDGKLALSTSDVGITLWDITVGREIRTFGTLAVAALFSQNGRQALGLSDALQTFDIASGKLIRRFNGNARRYLSTTPTAFSPDGKRVITGGKATEIWDVTTGRRLLRLEGDDDPAAMSVRRTIDERVIVKTSIAFSPDGSQILSGHRDKTLKLREAGKGKVMRSFKGHTGEVTSVAFSRDGKQALSLGSFYYGVLEDGEGDTVRLWDVATGETIRTLEHPGAYSATLSPDGKQALSTGSKGTHVWDLATGKIIRTLDVPSWSAVFSPDGRSAVVCSFGATEALNSASILLRSFSADHTMRLFDLGTGKEVRSFKGHSNRVRSVAFSPDGALLLSGSMDNTMKLWDVASGKEIRTFVGHLSNVDSVSFSPDGRLALSGSADSTARIWDVATGREILQMVGFDDGEWLSITPEGYFSASSPKAAENIGIRMGMNLYGIDQFYDVFYRPDIVEAALAGKDISGMVTLTIDEAIRNPPPVIVKVDAGHGAADTVQVAYRVKSNGGGIGDVRVFHNGKLVKSDAVARRAPDGLLGKKVGQITSDVLVNQMRGLSIVALKDSSLKTAALSTPKPDLYDSVVEIEPVPGENDISVVAFNAQNSIQSMASTVSFISSRPSIAPRLYILAVGIDQYKDSSSNLRFAVKDAGDIAARWKTQAADIYGEQNIFVEAVSNAEASRVGILGKIGEMVAKVKPTDHFVLFVASHGVLLGDQYYMLTSDYDGALQPSQLIGANEIVDFSKRVKALSQLYILDTCHAGGMGGVVSGLYDARVSVLAKKMGLHLFASASSADEALDGFEGNGLFTHTLLSGLNNNKQVDTNADNQISLMELGSYSKRETRTIATRMLHMQDPLIINFGQDNPVYRLH